MLSMNRVSWFLVYTIDFSSKRTYFSQYVQSSEEHGFLKLFVKYRSYLKICFLNQKLSFEMKLLMHARKVESSVKWSSFKEKWLWTANLLEFSNRPSSNDDQKPYWTSRTDLAGKRIDEWIRMDPIAILALYR
jgi:hypothetical protein